RLRVAAGARAHLDPARRRRVLERIRQQVVQHLAQAYRVGVRLDGIVGQLQLDDVPAVRRRSAVVLDRRTQELGEVQLLTPYDDGGIGPGQIEQVCDDRERAVDGALDALHERPLPVRQRSLDLHAEQLRVALRRTQRVLHVVRDAAQQ